VGLMVVLGLLIGRRAGRRMISGKPALPAK
jgi:hypothetical protein